MNIFYLLGIAMCTAKKEVTQDELNLYLFNTPSLNLLKKKDELTRTFFSIYNSILGENDELLKLDKSEIKEKDEIFECLLQSNFKNVQNFNCTFYKSKYIKELSCCLALLNKKRASSYVAHVSKNTTSCFFDSYFSNILDEKISDFYTNNNILHYIQDEFNMPLSHNGKYVKTELRFPMSVCFNMHRLISKLTGFQTSKLFGFNDLFKEIIKLSKGNKHIAKYDLETLKNKLNFNGSIQNKNLLNSAILNTKDAMQYTTSIAFSFISNLEKDLSPSDRNLLIMLGITYSKLKILNSCFKLEAEEKPKKKLAEYLKDLYGSFSLLSAYLLNFLKQDIYSIQALKAEDKKSYSDLSFDALLQHLEWANIMSYLPNNHSFIDFQDLITILHVPKQIENPKTSCGRFEAYLKPVTNVASYLYYLLSNGYRLKFWKERLSNYFTLENKTQLSFQGVNFGLLSDLQDIISPILDQLDDELSTVDEYNDNDTEFFALKKYIGLKAQVAALKRMHKIAESNNVRIYFKSHFEEQLIADLVGYLSLLLDHSNDKRLEALISLIETNCSKRQRAITLSYVAENLKIKNKNIFIKLVDANLFALINIGLSEAEEMADSLIALSKKSLPKSFFKSQTHESRSSNKNFFKNIKPSLICLMVTIAINLGLLGLHQKIKKSNNSRHN